MKFTLRQKKLARAKKNVLNREKQYARALMAQIKADKDVVRIKGMYDRAIQLTRNIEAKLTAEQIHQVNVWM